MTKQLANELTALAEKATLGPWSAFTEREQTGFRMVRTKIIADDPDIVLAEVKPDENGNEESNAALIVALRNNLPAIIAALRARSDGWQEGVEAAAKALEADAQLCDCHAHSSGECTCGAWDDYKSITAARAIEIVRELLPTPPETTP